MSAPKQHSRARSGVRASGWAMSVAIVGVSLGGCASSGFSMKSLPPETPAAENANAVRNAEAMVAAMKAKEQGENAKAQAAAAAGGGNDQPPPSSGATGAAAAGAAPSGASGGAAGALPAPAASTGESAGANAGTAASTATSGSGDQQPFVPLTAADVPSMYTYDPWERLNRFTYRFNARFDEVFFLPVANGYRRIPGPIRAGVHNFFSNLTEVDSFGNYILQARFLSSAKSLGRFVINSTLGIGGLFDVATKLNLPNPPTGFSATLGTWGVHSGPFLVIPLLGPSTLRDGVGYAGDYGLSYGVNVADLYRGWQSYGLSTTNAVDTRANVGFRYYATGSPFEYEIIRFLYVRKRLIEDEALHGRGKPKPRDVDAPAGK